MLNFREQLHDIHAYRLARTASSICLLFVAGFPAYLHGADQSDADTTRSGHAVTFGYANDDFYAEHEINALFGTDIFPAADDHVTGSFYLSFASMHRRDILTADLVYHILTDRRALYRSDLLALRIVNRHESSQYRYRYGFGMYLTGNIGGEKIQNGYHDLFGYQRVDLRYWQSVQGGGMAIGGIEYILAHTTDLELTPFISAFQPTGRVSGAGTAGMTVQYFRGSLRFEFVAGYSLRHDVSSTEQNIFGSSVFGGWLAETTITNSLSASVWMTRDLYGIRGEYHFGIYLRWNAGDRIPSTIREMFFP